VKVQCTTHEYCSCCIHLSVGAPKPVVGRYYTVTRVYRGEVDVQGPCDGYIISELPSPLSEQSGRPYPHCACTFRPVTESDPSFTEEVRRCRARERVADPLRELTR
jgi:hypothetical protein